MTEADKKIQLNAVDLILSRGVKFRLAPPRYSWKRLFKKEYYVEIHPLKLGTILEIVRVALDADIDTVMVKSDNEMLANNIEPIARCIAIAILNRDVAAKQRRVDKLTKHLLESLTVVSLLELYEIIRGMCHTKDFMSITIFLLQLTKMMGRREKGS